MREGIVAVRELDIVRGVMADLAARGQAEQAEAVGRVLAVAATALGERDGGSREYLTTGQAADILGVSRQTVVKWVTSGSLPGTHLGGRTLVHRDAVLRAADRLREPEPSGRGVRRPGRASAEALLRGLPAEKLARAEALHARLEGGESLSRAERREMAALESELADIAARALEQRARPARTKSG